MKLPSYSRKTKHFKEQQKLALIKFNALDLKVHDAVNERTKFINDNAYLFAEFDIGEEVIHKYAQHQNQKTKVTRYLRPYYGEVLDSFMHIKCQFENGDRTSYERGLHHGYISFEKWEKRRDKNSHQKNEA